MFYKNKVEMIAEEFMDYMFNFGKCSPCWFRRFCILIFPISLPIWFILLCFSLCIWFILTLVANIVEAWKCKHESRN